MYAGKYSKSRNYRPTSKIWSRLQKTQAYMDNKTTGWYVGGRKPSWINSTSSFIKGYANTKYRRQSD